MESNNIKFMVDSMLGKLGKYLRFMGYDVYYPPTTMSDDDILRIAEKDGRIILTRDKELARRSGGFYVESDKYEEQLKVVIKKFNLNGDKILSRCSVCNEILIPIEKEKIKEKVPDYVYEHNDEFYICPNCHRIYWYGTHTEKIKEKIEKIMEEIENEG